MYSQLAVVDSSHLVSAKTSGHRAPRSYILSPSFASGTESSNNFASALALSRGSMVSGADNLGKGIDRIWGRTHRHFCPTCGTRGEERTSSSLLRAGAWGHFRDFCLIFSALCPYTSCGRWMEVIGEVVSIDSPSLRGAGIGQGLGLGCGPM